MTVAVSKVNVQEENEEQSRDWFQILAVFLASLTSLGSAILLNWTSPTIPILIADEDLDIDINLASYLTIIPPVFTIIFAPLYGIGLDRLGRKLCLISIGVLHVCSWLCIMFAESLYIFYLSRVFYGISHGGMLTVLPAYIAEVATPKVRGRWGNLMGFFLYFGQFVMNAIGYYFSIKVSAYIMIALPIGFLIAFSLMPETPYYYLKIDKPKEAEESLKRLRRRKNVDDEFLQISADVKRQLSEPGTYMDCFRIPSNRKAVLILILGRGMQQFSGVSALAVYNQYIFEEAGTALNGGHSSMIYTAILSVVNFLALVFLDKFGRKWPMVFSSIGCFLSLGAETVYFILKEYDIVDVTPVSWFPVVGMVLYTVAFALGLGLIPILLLSELFSTSIRSKASTIITIMFGVYLIIGNYLFPFLNSTFGLYAPFAFFALCSFLSIFLSYWFIPETKGKTLEEIQQMLKESDKPKS